MGSWISQQSPVAMRIVKNVLIAIFKTHWRIFPVVLDAVMVLAAIGFFIVSLDDRTTPATKSFAAMCGMGGAYLVMMTRELRGHWQDYREEMRSL